MKTTLYTYATLHKNSYGKAHRIKRQHLIIIFTILCLITPGTNWLIPLSKKIIQRDIIIRK